MTKESAQKKSGLEQDTGMLLNPKERTGCQQLAAGEAPHNQRAQALLALDEGATQESAGQRAGLTKGQVRYWLGKFRKARMAIFPKSPSAPTPTPDAPPAPEITIEESPVEQPKPVKESPQEAELAVIGADAVKESAKKKQAAPKKSKKVKKPNKGAKEKAGKKPKKKKKNGKGKKDKKSKKKKKPQQAEAGKKQKIKSKKAEGSAKSKKKNTSKKQTGKKGKKKSKVQTQIS